jgi:uncharacterized protein (TIGR02302 family)
MMIAKFIAMGQKSASRAKGCGRAMVAALILAIALCAPAFSTAAKAQEALDELLENAERAMRDSVDNLKSKKTDGSLSNQSEAIENLEKYAFRPRVLSDRDLKSMLDRLERLSKSGDKDAAKQLLEQLQQMLENLQMAQPGQPGDSEMEQALNELGDMIRKQQQLRDKTFKQGQDSRRDRMRGKQNDQGMGDLQQDQQGLRDRLKKLQQELAKRGMGQGQKGQKGQPGEQGQPGDDGDQQGDSGDALGDADNAMGDADGKLGDGNADGAVDSQGQALDALRKGAQSLAEAMQQGDGDGQGDGPGNRVGRQQSGGNTTDPLGRPLHGREFGDETVKIPGEIDVQRARRILEELRRRLGDTQRPQLELDYLERLLKDY